MKHTRRLILCALASAFPVYPRAIEPRGDDYSYGTDWVTQYTTVTLSGDSNTSPAVQTETGTYTTTVTQWLPAPTASAGTILITVTAAVIENPYAVTTTVYEQEGYTTTTDINNDGGETSYTTTYVSNNDQYTTVWESGAGSTSSPDTSNKQYDLPCNAGGEDQKEPGTLSVTPIQRNTLYVIALMIPATLLGWNFIIIRALLFPLKMLTVAIHEVGHCLGALATGYRILTVSIDPTPGGQTILLVPEGEELIYPAAMFPLGFVFSSFFGGLLVFCGFDTLASKVASFFVGMGLLFVLYRSGNFGGRLFSLGHLGLMIGLWFIDHGSALRFYILLVGIMSSFYVLYDTIDDLLFRKEFPCCCMLHLHRFGPRLPIIGYFAGYLGLSIILLACFIVAAIAAFRQTSHAMYCQSQTFLPT